MPSGKIHSFSTAALSAALWLAAHQAGYPDQQTAALAAGSLAGLLLTPDLDVNRGNISNQHVRRLGGCFVGLLWALIWRPYSLLIPHRSFLSHMPLVGTVIRLGYLVGLAWLVVTVFHLAGVRWPALPGWWPWAFAGLALADLLHFIMDKTLRN